MARCRMPSAVQCALVLVACVLGAEAQSCLDWKGTLGRTESDGYVDAVMGVIEPFFSGTLFLPPEASVNRLLAANSSLSAADVLQYHLVPSLSPVDAAVNASKPVAVKTLLDSNDKPTICPDDQLTETTLTYDASTGQTTVNGIAADVAAAHGTCNGFVVPIGSVLLPRCLNLDGAVPACKAPSTIKALQAMKQTAAALLAELLPPRFEGTVFVPSDAALKTLFANLSLPFPLPASSNASTFLTDIALYHAIPSAALTPPTAAPPAATLPTALATAPSQSLCRTVPPATLAAVGPPLKLTPAAGAAVTPAAAAATPTCRGVIYAIDSVLLPCALDKAWLVAPVAVPNPSPPASPIPSPTPAAVASQSPTARSAPAPSSSAAAPRYPPAFAAALVALAAAASWLAVVL